MRWQHMHGRGQTQADTGRLHGCGAHSHPSTRARAEPAPRAPPVMSDRTQECHPCPWRAATPPMTPSFLLGARDTRHIFILCQFLRLPVKTGFGFTRFRWRTGRNGNSCSHPCKRAPSTLPVCARQAQDRRASVSPFPPQK